MLKIILVIVTERKNKANNYVVEKVGIYINQNNSILIQIIKALNQ